MNISMRPTDFGIYVLLHIHYNAVPSRYFYGGHMYLKLSLEGCDSTALKRNKIPKVRPV